MVTIPKRIVEIKAATSSGAGRSWTDLYASFKIDRTIGRAPNKAEVKLFNLNPDSIGYLEQKDMVLQVMAGEGVAGQLFLGDILKRQVHTRIESPNQVTTILASDGKRTYQSDNVYAASFPPGTTRNQILSDMLSVKGIKRGYIDSTIIDVTYQSGMAFYAPVREVLDDLFESELWSLQNNTLQIIPDGLARQGNALLVSADTNMIGIPERTDKGVKVMIHLYNIDPGQAIQLKSKFINGLYRVEGVTHEGDSNATRWHTKLTCKTL